MRKFLFCRLDNGILHSTIYLLITDISADNEIEYRFLNLATYRLESKIFKKSAEALDWLDNMAEACNGYWESIEV